MMKDRVQVGFVLAALLTGGCGPGASPTSPTASAMLPTFTPGNYTLLLSMPGTPPVQLGSFVLTTEMCISMGAGAVGSTTLDVTVDVQGTQIIGQSTNGSLVLSMQTIGAAIGGGLSGAATNSAAGVSMAVQPRPGETSVGLSGTVTSSRTMSGYADGSIQFYTSAGSYGCNSANWSLSPR